MGFVPGDLNCLVKVPGNADIFEISFRTANILERFWNLYREGKGKAPLSNFDVEPLSDTENKVVTVQFYNEAVQDHDVSTWLGRYGLVKSEARRVLDEDGVWTGARKWLVQLKPDPSAPGGVCHIPSSITLGRHRGAVFYYGMPKLCRNCGELGHLAAACTVVKCKTCGGEHETRACRDPKPCNLCGARGHLFRDCPLSYANRARSTVPPPPSAAPPPAPQPPPPTPMPRTRPPTPTPSQPGSPPPQAQTTAQDPTLGITTPGTPNSTVPPAELGPTNPVTVKEEPDSDTPIVVLESDSSTSESDSITPWQKIKKRKGKRIRSPTSIIQEPPIQPPNPAIVRQKTHTTKTPKQLSSKPEHRQQPIARPEPPPCPTKPSTPPLIHHRETLQNTITAHARIVRDQPASGPDPVKGTGASPSSQGPPGTGGKPGARTPAPTSPGRNLPGSQEGRPGSAHGPGVSRRLNNQDIVNQKLNKICKDIANSNIGS
ncbi:hypothetical protein ANANG_G00138900 [Anguilla anguilla]|uniref:CCHC-type domain-containing protein n=1 Tax=Anguilla anguilla TaxID=7936 RepID=A0A9D3MGE4_ANGAN|nr:hypothetical protein ANANG_G00138900 [Anguilla anguilla]